MNEFRLALIVLSAVVLSPIAAQVTPPAPEAPSPPEASAEEEAPVSIFDQKIGDVGVQFEADGTWTTHLAAGWGEGLTSDGALPGLGYPGFAKEPEFQQIPDFSMTLRLLERYYVQINYRTTTDDRSFLFGYDGQPGELLQWVKVGTAGFSVPGRAGETLPEGRPGAFASGAAFSLGSVSLESLARYEDSSRETHTYQGYRDLTLATVPLDAWIRGRFFRLPGTAPFSSVQILIEDPTGPFGGFRNLKPGEALVDSATGEVRLPAAATRRYLVSWSGASVPDTALLKIHTVPFVASGLPAGTWYVLTQPGVSTAFELRNRYPVTAGVTGSILIYDNDSGNPVPGWPVSQSPSNDWFQVTGAEEAPFFAAHDYVFQGIYPYRDQGAPPPQSKVLPWSFRLPTVSTATSYALGTDVIPSSIIVERNGVVATGWQFDPAAGTLKFDFPVFETDEVVISLERRKTGNAASDLVLWHGGRWDISTSQNLEWNVQSRWNLAKDQSTTEDLQSPGRIAGTVAWTGNSDQWAWSVKGTAGALKADSTGHRILYGQGDAGTQAALDGDALRPASVPDLSGAPGGPSNLTETSRAKTFFRNYWTNDPLTGTPVAGRWGTPGVGQSPFAAGGNVGPYVVLGDGISTDRLAVLETDMTANQWAGLDVFVDKGHPVDLRSTSAVTLNIRVPNGTGTYKVYFQAGPLSTNFDGTGAVRAVVYRTQPSLPFFSQAVGATQYFPIPEGSSWGNDPEVGSTVPDGDVFTYDLTASGLNTASTDWQTVRLILKDSDRQKLQAATGWRLVVVDSGSGGSRTVLTGPVIFEGSTWSVVPDGSTVGSVNPAELSDPTNVNGGQLRVDWSDRTGWSVQGRQNPVRPVSYGTIAFKYKLNGLATTPTTLTVKLSDYRGRGITATWPAANTADWVQARIGIRPKTLTLNGVPAGSVTLSSGAMITSWDRMTITQTGSDSGTLYVSDIEAVDALWEPVASTLATATWTQGAAWPSADFPVVSGMTVGLTSSQDGATADTATWRGQTVWSGSIGPIRSSGEASYAATPEGNQAHGAYDATLPLGLPLGVSLALSEQFSDEGLRSEGVSLGLPLLGTLETTVKVSGPPLTLDQDYLASWNASWQGDWAASLSAEWNQTRPFTGTFGDFAHQWTDSWSWLAPAAETAPYYLVEGQSTLRTPFLWGPLDALVKGQVAQSVGPTTTWSPSATWQLRSSMHVADTWSVTPTLSREVSAVFERDSLTPQQSAEQAAEWIGSQTDGLFTWPFSESSGSASPWSRAPEGLQSGLVQSSAGLDWDRDSRSDWTDLAFPRTGGADVKTTRGIEGPAEYRALEIGAHLEAQALNLFGSLGSQPVFNWYRTDVWTWTTAGSWQTGTRIQDRIAQASAAVRSELVLTQQESVTLPAAYQGTWSTTPSQTWNLQPTWSLKQPANLPFDLPRWLSPAAFHREWVQEVTAALAFGWTPDPAPLLKDLHVSWKGRFLLSDKSELDFTTQWGQQWQTGLTVIGLEVAIDFILSF